MPVKPIKRDETLMPLSREHHFDLLLAWKIRNGLKAGSKLSRIAAYVGYLDDNLMKAHFYDEERLLFDALPPDDALCARARKEHDGIRSLLAAIRGEGGQEPSLYPRLADAIEAHVRYEERELFPYLEQKIPQAALQEIAAEIALDHDGFIEVWEDNFWDVPRQV